MGQGGVKSGEVKSGWAALPLTVRLLVNLQSVALVVFLFDERLLPELLVGTLIVAFFSWGLWVGNQSVWLLALVGATTSFAFVVTRDPNLPWSYGALLGLAIVLLVATPTRDWVRIKTTGRRGAAVPAPPA